MMEKTSRQIIEEAIHSKEFIDGIKEAFDFFDTIRIAYKTNNVFVLESVVKALQRRIAELNIMFWFIRIEAVENNITEKLEKIRRWKRYEDLEKVCEENWFGSEFVLWDIVECYIINGIDLKKFPEHLKIVCDEYKELLQNEAK